MSRFNFAFTSPLGLRPSLLLKLGAFWLVLLFAAASLPAQVYTDLHDFNCTIEGCPSLYPEVFAQGRDGNLYGTTNEGGTSNMGTVFVATPAGVITTLYNFSGLDGQNPNSGLTLGPDGNFYGATRVGGANGTGTIFKITPAGVLTTLHSFKNGEGSNPLGAPALGKNGSFYGTTCAQFAPWTAYSITPAGAFQIISGSVPPCPYGPLILASDGNFYGTSQAGGTTYQGTVFRMTPAGNISILHSFAYTDGAYLYSPLVQGKDGLLYGTTSGGGTPQAGVVFKLNLSGGAYTILHQFDGTQGKDGTSPFAGLVAASDGNFYGATSEGANAGPVPEGALFEINSSGHKYSNLYAFDGTHGTLEEATPMQHTNGKIYGTTIRGGAFSGGVMFSLDNSLPPFLSLVPAFAGSGKTVGILGQGFTGTTSVTFGSVVATFHVISDTYLTAVVPANASGGFVTVTTPSGTLTSKFQMHVVPSITTFSPTSGPVGTLVTIAGTGFLGATQVTFGNVPATTFTVNSASNITATVPAAAVTGKVGVRTPGGTASSSAPSTDPP